MASLIPPGYNLVAGGGGAGSITSTFAIFAPAGQAAQGNAAVANNLVAQYMGAQSPQGNAQVQARNALYDAYNAAIAAGVPGGMVSSLGSSGQIEQMTEAWLASQPKANTVQIQSRSVDVENGRDVSIDRAGNVEIAAKNVTLVPQRVDLSDLDRYRGGLATPAMAEEVLRKLIGPQATSMQEVVESNERLAESNQKTAETTRPVEVTVNYSPTTTDGSSGSLQEKRDAERIGKLVGKAVELELRKAQQGNV